MKLKKLVYVSVFVLLLLLTVACSETSDASGDDVTLKLAHTGSDAHQYNTAAEKFKELVEEKTDGSVKIEIHGNATLGSEADVVEQVMDGSIEMTTLAADSSFANTVPEM